MREIFSIMLSMLVVATQANELHSVRGARDLAISRGSSYCYEAYVRRHSNTHTHTHTLSLSHTHTQYLSFFLVDSAFLRRTISLSLSQHKHRIVDWSTLRITSNTVTVVSLETVGIRSRTWALFRYATWTRLKRRVTAKAVACVT